MKDYFTIEFVRQDKNGINTYHLISREFTWHKANKRFLELIKAYPDQKIELNSTQWVNTAMGYMPIAWNNPKN